jgi:hypothetical protein
MISLNNRFVVEPYLSDRAIKLSQNGSGFAMIQQKVTLVGLKLLMSVHVQYPSESKYFPAGSTVYIREEYLHSQPWAKQLLESKAIEGKFMIVDHQFVEFVD